MTRNEEKMRPWLQGALGLRDSATPFPWQSDLLERFTRGELPNALDIPTGLGKTAVIGVWLVARASGAAVPRRLVYVVDRRAVVDQATAEAERLRSWVSGHPEVKAALGIDPDRALPISTLRGQFVDNREWLEDPSSPAIVLGTVDMIGSRLLFSGYGVSRKMRPYQAGLLGVDSLIVLDEAHLVPPFERLIEQVASGRDSSSRPLEADNAALQRLAPRLRVLSLSATGRDREAEQVLRLGKADGEHAEVRRRLSAVKRLTVRPEVGDKELPEVLAAAAWKLSGEGEDAARVVVFVTSRDHAQKTLEAIESLGAKAKRTIATELFVGGRRVYERQLAATWLEDHGFIPTSGKMSEMPAFLIATAAGEVGVDFDANHAVCDLVAWERMVQRLGRVNRRGLNDANVVVVTTSAKDALESQRRSAVLKLFDVLPRLADGAMDVSPCALSLLKEKQESRTLIEEASTPPPLHPPLTRALVESWSMTSLEEHTGRPEVTPWIRGWPDDEEEPQTTIVWRTYLPVTSTGDLLGGKDLEAFWDAADPHLAEKLETETWRVVEWLSKRLKKLEPSTPEDAELNRFARPLRNADVVGVILGSDGLTRVVFADDLSNKGKRDAMERAFRGATLIVDRRAGGLVRGLLASDSDDLVDDVTDLDAHNGARIVPFQIKHMSQENDETESHDWRTEAIVPIARSDREISEWLVVESLAEHGAQSEEGRSGAKRSQLLDEHEAWTEIEARRIATRLALAPEHADLLATAARLHDEGKRASAWQRAFGGDVSNPIAKSTRRPNIKFLEGYRHELGSLPYAETHERVKELPLALRELCLHLIAAHHGGARPILRTSGAPEPPSQLVKRAREIALRFAALEKTWGPWGLAWWEALLRAADQRASRRNDVEARRG